jgi:hypothetical protein
MRIWLRRAAVLAPLGLLAQIPDASQSSPRRRREREDEPVRLPNGKLQRDELLKHEYEQNVKDAGQLLSMAKELKEDLDKNLQYVLSLGCIKKTEEIEKLARRIRSRMQRF